MKRRRSFKGEGDVAGLGNAGSKDNMGLIGMVRAAREGRGVLRDMEG